MKSAYSKSAAARSGGVLTGCSGGYPIDWAVCAEPYYSYTAGNITEPREINGQSATRFLKTSVNASIRELDGHVG